MKGMNVKVMLMKCMIHFTHNERYECNGDVNERYECKGDVNEMYECKGDVNEMYDTFHTR